LSERFIPAHGGHKKLLSYQKAEIVYDATVYFCERFVARNDRTRDQMIQAARSCKQNIVEGSMASATSKEGEVKLTGVARASLEELLEDYRDSMRARGIQEWPAEHPWAKRLRDLNRIPGATCETFRKGIEHEAPAICANVIAGLIRVTSYLLQSSAEDRPFRPCCPCCPYFASTISPTSNRYICRPLSSWVLSMVTRRPSRLERGCRSQRHSPAPPWR